MLKRVLLVSSSAAGAVSAASSQMLFPDARSQREPVSLDASQLATFEQFALFADNVEARDMHVRRYHAVDGFEADPSLDVELSPRSQAEVQRAAIQEGLQEIQSNPLRPEELEAAAAIVIAPSETNKQLLDASHSLIVHSQYCNALEALNMHSGVLQNMATVAQGMLANDEELANALARSLLRISGQNPSIKRTKTVPHTAPKHDESISDPGVDAWDELRKMYKCTICQDVMCVPHLVIECVHSFCGACIQQHIKINSEDCDAICCPKCRQEIEQQPCYEPDFDHRILSDVQCAAESDSKEYWLERREEFLPKLYLERKNQRAKHDADGDEEDFWASNPYLHSILGLMAVILVLVVVMRKRVPSGTK